MAGPQIRDILMHDDIEFPEVTQAMVDAGQNFIMAKTGQWPSAQMVLETYLEMVKAKPRYDPVSGHGKLEQRISIYEDNLKRHRESVVMRRADWTDG